MIPKYSLPYRLYFTFFCLPGYDLLLQSDGHVASRWLQKRGVVVYYKDLINLTDISVFTNFFIIPKEK